MNHSSKSKQINVLLGVLGAGIGMGVLIAMIMLYYYNPTGSYNVANVLLDPDNAYSLRYIEPDQKGKTEGRYAFEGMYFSFFEPQTKQFQSKPLAKDKYAVFYQRIAKDKSITDPNAEVKNMFDRSQTANLALKVRPAGDDSTRGVESVFSRIDFAGNGDYYRIQLRQSAPGSEWTYYYHPKIYQEALDIFTHSKVSYD